MKKEEIKEENVQEDVLTSSDPKENPRYPALANYAEIIKFMGWLVLVVVALAVFMSYIKNDNFDEALYLIIVGPVAVIGLLVTGELLKVIIDIEKNTRKK